MIKGSRPSLLALKIVANVFVNKRGITIKDISRNLKTDYKNVYDTVNALFKTGIIRKEKIGNYNLCSVNMDYDDLIIFLSEHNIYNKLKPFKSRYPTEYRIIKEACRKNIENTPCFVCLVFGSY
ncbi:hypothetical protein CL622_01210, partial [archaeon]|nr:hypothetical protein [archaeon]